MEIYPLLRCVLIRELLLIIIINLCVDVRVFRIKDIVTTTNPIIAYTVQVISNMLEGQTRRFKKSPVSEINRKPGKSLRCILNVLRQSPIKTQLGNFKTGIVA